MQSLIFIFHGEEDYAQCSKGAPLRSLRSLCFAKSSGNEDYVDGKTRERMPGNARRVDKQAPKRTYTRKKRKFHGNKYTKIPILTKPIAVENLETRSSKTIHEIPVKKTENTFEGYRLFDMCVFDNIIKSLECPQCHSTNTLFVEEIDSKRKDLASCLLVKCLKCTYASCLLVKCLKCTYAMQNYTS